MKRNKKQEEQQELRRIARRHDEIGYSRHLMEWVPVDEPQFIGWEYKVVLTDQGSRRRDALVLQELLTKLGREQFYSSEAFVKVVRQNKHRIDFIRSYRKLTCTYSWHLDAMFGNLINEYKHAQLSIEAQNYFDIEYTERWGNIYKQYRLKPGFPYYETKIKVTKAYSTHRGIPQGDLISESDFLWKIMEDRRWYSTKNGYSRYQDDWYPRCKKAMTRMQNRRRWKIALNQFSDDESLEYHEAKTYKRI